MKSCTKCGKVFEYGGKGNRSHCNPCRAARAREWRRANPERSRIYKQRYHAKHPEKERERKRRAYADAEYRERHLRAQREWRARNPEAMGRHNERRRSNGYSSLVRYGVTPEQRQELEARQDGCCGICGISLVSLRPRDIHIDHDHETGFVRGILCSPCNRHLGWSATFRLVADRYLGAEHMTPASPRRWKPKP